jgi:hypothetical protein
MPNAETYAKLHREFLEKHHPKTYKMLEESGGLVDHLKMVGETAINLYETISTQMATSKNLPKEYAVRVQELKQIPHVVHEIVPNDVVHNPGAVASDPLQSTRRSPIYDAPQGS